MNRSWLKALVSASVLTLGVCVLPAATWAQAQTPPPPGWSPEGKLTVSIDENGVLIGNGQQLTCVIVRGVPTFSLGEMVVAGDVLFTDPIPPQGAQPLTSDILRFPALPNSNLSNTIQLLSDVTDGVDNASDVGLDVDLQPNHLTVAEDPSEITLYTAGINSYTVYSDAGIVPEPGSLALLATGGLPLLGFLRRRRLSA